MQGQKLRTPKTLPVKKFLLATTLFLSLGGLLKSQTTLVNPAGDGGFETGTTFAASNWTAVNGTQSNRWFVGTVPAGFTGARCVHISKANNGSTYLYDLTSYDVSHFYRDITFPAGQPTITLSFKVQCVGELNADYLQVSLVPTTLTPTVGSLLYTGQVGSNITGISTWTTVTMTLPCNAAGTTQRLVFSWADDGSSTGAQGPAAIDNISVVSSSVVPTCASLLGTGVTNVASLPYASGPGTTCGAVDDLNANNAIICGLNYYYGGEDQVWVFTPATSGNVTIALTSSGSYTGLMLYQGCPSGCSGSPGTCVANNQDYNGSKSLCAPVVAGQQYYLVLDSWPYPTCNAYSNLTISAPTGIPAGTTCANAPSITLPYNATGQTTACYGDDYNNSSTGSCGSLYESGEDHVYALTVASAQCIGVTLSNASSYNIGFQVYSGCPGSAGASCVGSYGGSNPLSGTVVLPSAGTYYIVVDSWANPYNVNYDISVTSYGSGPANDLPCNAISLPINGTLSGDNSCSGGSGEPAAPACWYNGNLNTVWYKVICPASGSIKVTTGLGSLTDTQIALWTGSCGSLTLVANGCNDNAGVCSGYVYYSQVVVGGLTPGATYYVSVDGYYTYTGTFTISAYDGQNLIPTNQDCSGAISVCSSFITQTNSYFGCGNIQDVPPSGSVPGNPATNVNSTNTGCMLSGELNTVWYSITISANGNLAWTVLKPGGGYYDWNLYPRTTNTCADIGNNTIAPVRCNWNCSSIGGTGMQTVGNVPAGSTACNFEAPLAVTAGQTYELALSNFSGTTGGITLDFSNSTCGIAVPTAITWSGNVSTAWALAANWGGCSPPACGIDATIVSSMNQPVISVNSTVRSLTIQPGATLTINPGITLTICGDLNVLGSLIASPTSTILFNNGSTVQNITGLITGSNAVGNLTITKTGGSVVLANDIDMSGTFTTSNATSVFNTAGHYVKVAGNFVNASGNTTFANTNATGTLEFNGTAAQTYNQGATQLDLNYVVMNHSGTGVTLQTNMVMKPTTGSLTLTAGKIITGVNEVRVYNTTPACVTIGNTTSYVEGFLRRWTLTGLYEFPVGESVKGYERASVNFTANTNVNNLRANFVQYASTPAALGTLDCAATYNMPALDDGKWIINAFDATLTQLTGTCTYDMVLYNRAGSYTNSAGSNAWTIMKDPGGTGAWALYGTCNAASTLNATKRNGMSGFSHFGTAMSTTPLPIELLNFNGENLGERNRLVWSTATETNNDYFTLEHSSDGVNFSEVTRVDGSGTTTQQHNYETFDNYPNSGFNYYRLKQTDFNGAFSYSGIIVIENKFVIASVENIHPNPSNGELNFDLLSTEKGPLLIEVMDITGRVVLTNSVDIQDGKNSLKIDLTPLAQGTYMLRVSMGCCNFSAINKVIKE
jgi:hypothetical protein